METGSVVVCRALLWDCGDVFGRLAVVIHERLAAMDDPMERHALVKSLSPGAQTGVMDLLRRWRFVAVDSEGIRMTPDAMRQCVAGAVQETDRRIDAEARGLMDTEVIVICQKCQSVFEAVDLASTGGACRCCGAMGDDIIRRPASLAHHSLVVRVLNFRQRTRALTLVLR